MSFYIQDVDKMRHKNISQISIYSQGSLRIDPKLAVKTFWQSFTITLNNWRKGFEVESIKTYRKHFYTNHYIEVDIWCRSAFYVRKKGETFQTILVWASLSWCHFLSSSKVISVTNVLLLFLFYINQDILNICVD